MRKVLVVVALLAVALAATPASAVLDNVNGLTSGQVQGKFTNFSDLYTPGDPGTSGIPLAFGAAVANGMENRAIFNATSVQTPGGTPLWFPTSQQLTGLFYNLNVIAHTTALGGLSGTDTILTLDFGVSTRTTPLSGPGLLTNPSGAGGVLQVYLQSGTSNFNASPNTIKVLSIPTVGTTTASVNGADPVNDGNWGPAAWVQGSGTGSDTYPGSSGTSSQLWLSGDFVLFSDIGLTGHATGTVLSETLDLNTGVGSATGYVHLIGGSFYSNVGKGDVGRGPEVDLTLTANESALGNDPTGTFFTGTAGSAWSGVGYWPVDSQDPVVFDVLIIPEPATLSLLGFGLAGLLFRRRK